MQTLESDSFKLPGEKAVQAVAQHSARKGNLQNAIFEEVHP